MTLTATQTARPEIPLALFPGMTDLEHALYYVAQRNQNAIAISAREAGRSGGVCWSGMSGSNYTPKTYDEMLADAHDSLARRAAAAEIMAVAG